MVRAPKVRAFGARWQWPPAATQLKAGGVMEASRVDRATGKCRHVRRGGAASAVIAFAMLSSPVWGQQRTELAPAGQEGIPPPTRVEGTPPTRVEGNPSQTRADNDLPLSTIRRAQQALIQAGYRVTAADGVWGPQSADAMRAFQRDRGLPPTGQPDARSLATLGVTADGTRTPARPLGQVAPRVRTPAADLDRVTVRAIQEALRKQGFQVGPVDGAWGQRTTSAVGNFQRSRGMAASGDLDAATLAALGFLPDSSRTLPRDGKPARATDLDPAAIRMIQQALNDRGYAVGAADGTWGDRTIGALRDFQRAQGIDSTGEPDVYTLVALDLLPSDRVRKVR
jgi:peptidoglycan hydrolase-like protein with peptidoglycan-binding domain